MHNSYFMYHFSAMIDKNVPISTNLPTTWLLTSTSRCKVLLWWLLLMQILWIAKFFSSLNALNDFKFSFHFSHANVTKLSRYFNFPRINKIVSIEDKTILHLINYLKIFNRAYILPLGYPLVMFPWFCLQL
jgi:hypothetical protein